MAHAAIIIEGGLFASDLLDRIAAAPDDVPGQKSADFGIDGTRLSDEIQNAFSDARLHWEGFKRRRERSRESLTTLTREFWVIPLLEILGYELTYQPRAAVVDGNNYAISHRPGDDPDAPPVHIVATDRKLDSRGEDGQRSPHALVQDYLNRTDPLWGIVTNGLRLRLLRDSARLARPTFVEFDLEAILEENLYSEFVVFWRLCHRSRLPQGADDAHECLFEQYHQQGIDEGGRVRERLREGIEEALVILGTGFLQHPDSEGLREALGAGRLDDVGYYRQLLRLIYRLLFLMVAEERRLLLLPDHENRARQDIYTRWYSVARLRDRAEQRTLDDPHGDLWESLKRTFRLFREEEEADQLGLTALNGELFGIDACHDLEQAAIRNDLLLRAVFNLSTFREREGRRGRGKGVRRRVNYAALDVEELGSVYESLLDFHPQVSVEQRRFDLAAGSERKTTGSYYTPPALVRELIKSALEPVLEERLKAADTRDAKIAAILDLKICDPAAGSGHFLLAAARRLGRELAIVRSGEAEPTPTDYRAAVRDVIRNCIYAVDQNPLAVDLCKVALWIEGHAAGFPLSFLDHRVKRGNSLIGVFDLEVLETGIPDGAYKKLTGDDGDTVKDLKARNKKERAGEQILGGFFDTDTSTATAQLAKAAARIDDIDETTPDDVHRKEELYAALHDRGTEWHRLKTACDLWCAAFFTDKQPVTGTGQEIVPTTEIVHQARAGRTPPNRMGAMADTLAERHGFFHWPLEFPDAFDAGGFDVMLGNPPWERIKLQEKEFFAPYDREIADAPNKAARARLIATLFAGDAPPERRALGEKFLKAKHAAEAQGEFLRHSSRYPLTAVGDINTYAVFAETFLRAIGEVGRAGFIVPTGIATDATTAPFFGALTAQGRLSRLISFYEVRRWFKGTDERKPFCLLTIGTANNATFAHEVKELDGSVPKEKIFQLTPGEIALLNPNTRTWPVFRSQTDAIFTKAIYRNIPVLIDENDEKNGNPWGIRFTAMLHMANDSGLFRTAAQLSAAGASRDGRDWFLPSGERLLPLYEGKMFSIYDHRFGTFENISVRPPPGTSLPRPAGVQLLDYGYEVEPWYWVAESDVQTFAEHRIKQWFFVFRDVTNTTAERTFIGSVIPRSAVNHKAPLLISNCEPRLVSGLIANLSSLTLDFLAR